MKRYVEAAAFIAATAVVIWTVDRLLDKLFGCPCK